jgi:hypothetical protein
VTRYPVTDTRVDFVPMIGVEQDIVDIMHDCLIPVNEDDVPVITGQEQCAAKIVEMLRAKGIEV